MTYERNPSTGEMIIRLTEEETRLFEGMTMDRIAFRLAETIVTLQGENLVKEVWKRKATIIDRLEAKIVKKAMDKVESAVERGGLRT